MGGVPSIGADFLGDELRWDFSKEERHVKDGLAVVCIRLSSFVKLTVRIRCKAKISQHIV
jgi:hypothetical protein